MLYQLRMPENITSGVTGDETRGEVTDSKRVGYETARQALKRRLFALIRNFDTI